MAWSVLVRIPEAEAYAAVNTVEWAMAGALGFAVLAISALGIWGGTVAARPLRGMTEAMRRLAGNDLGVEIPAKDRGDEIGATAQSVQVFKDSMIETERLRAYQEASKQRAEEERRMAMSDLASKFEASVGTIVEGVASAATELQSSAQAMASTADGATRQSTTVAAASEQATQNV